MTTRTNTVLDPNVLTALGGTVATGDDLRFTQPGPAVYNAGLDSLTGYALLTTYIGGLCRSSFGADGSSLEIDTDDLFIEGERDYAYLAGVAAQTITKLLEGGARRGFFWANAAITNARCLAGSHTFAGSADVTHLDAHVGALVNLRQGGAKATNVRAHAGSRINCERDATNAEANGGTDGPGVLALTHADAALDAAVLRGGVIRPTLARPATLTSYGGTIDLRDADGVWTAGMINIYGPTKVIPPNAWAGNWYGSATLNDDYKLVNIGSPSSAGV